MTIRPVSNGNVASLRARANYQPDCAALARNRISMARTSAGMSPAEFAALLSSLVGRAVTAGHVLSWETTATPPGDVLIAADTVSSSAGRLGVRSHKFIVGYIGHEGAALISRGMDENDLGGSECRSIVVDHPSGHCELYVWPYGSVIYHLVEDHDVSSVATLALWRVRTYVDNLAWASGALQSMTGSSQAEASYVLSSYWVHTPIWAGRVLDSALRLICSPRVLLDRDVDDSETPANSAHETEQALLADGYEHSGIRSFGMKGISAGFASWSGVSYYPGDPERALAENELVTFELCLQSIWGYCEHINAQIEQGSGPVAAEGYGYRFLRAAKSRLTTPRAQEKGQHQAMRAAIVETSGLTEHLAQALETLREENGQCVSSIPSWS